jgi:hypothetical protein
MRSFFRQGIYIAVIAASTIALASDNLSVEKMSPELSAMNIWVGHWQSQTRVLDTPYSEAATVSSEMTCTWSPDHGFVLCEHLMHHTDGATTNSLSVYTYDDRDKVYKFFGVEKDSLPREVPMEVKGNVWSFGTEVQNQDKTIMFLTSDEFLSGTSMRFHTEFSDDNGQHWKELNQGELIKVS